MDKVNNAGVFEGLTNTNNKPVLANHVLLNEYLPGMYEHIYRIQ